MTRPGNDSGRRSTRPINAPQTLIGRVLDGRFRLDRVISAGGMGIIFEATQLTIQRTVAVKLLKPTLSNDTDLIQRFFQEVDVVATLQHPNIVAMVDAGKDASGLAYLVMEYFDGSTLREMLQRFELNLLDLLEIFIQVCDALTEAHAQGVIHRDLKFDNIMVKRLRDHRLHVKILDFGVAKLLGSDLNLTRGGQVPGTPGIIAPELVDGRQPAPQSDLYSLGVLLFTTLAGKAPYHAENELALMRAHQTEPIPNAAEFSHRYVPQEFIKLTRELMGKTPEVRPKSARIVRERLEQILNQCRRSGLDYPRYVPPLFENQEDANISGAFAINIATRASARAMEESFINQLNQSQPLKDDRDSPILVPSSVVVALVFLLMVLVMICLALLYQLFGKG